MKYYAYQNDTSEFYVSLSDDDVATIYRKGAEGWEESPYGVAPRTIRRSHHWVEIENPAGKPKAKASKK